MGAMPRGHSGAWPFAIGAPCVVGEAADVETPGPATVGDAAPGGAVFGGGPGSPDEPRRAPQCVQKRACGLVGAPQWPQNLATAIDIVKERASLCRAGRHSGLYKQEANVQGHSLPLQQRTAKTPGPHTYSPKYNARPYTVFTSPAVGAGSVNCRTGSAGVSPVPVAPRDGRDARAPSDAPGHSPRRLFAERRRRLRSSSPWPILSSGAVHHSSWSR